MSIHLWQKSLQWGCRTRTWARLLPWQSFSSALEEPKMSCIDCIANCIANRFWLKLLASCLQAACMCRFLELWFNLVLFEVGHLSLCGRRPAASRSQATTATYGESLASLVNESSEVPADVFFWGTALPRGLKDFREDF